MSKKSHFRYRDSMTGFLHFCAEKFHLEKLANVREKHLRAYVDYRRQAGISEKTLKNDLAAIRFFHQFTGSRNVLPDNRELGMAKTPPGGKDRAWTDEEHRLMMEKAVGLGRQDVVLAMKLARLAGLRIHECARLTVGHIEDALKEGEVTIKGKGGRVRRVPVSPELRVELERILAGSGGARERKIFVEPGQKTHQVIRSIEKFIRDHRQEFTEQSDHAAWAAPLIRQRGIRAERRRLQRQAADKRGQDACGGAVGARQAGGDEHLPAWWQVIYMVLCNRTVFPIFTKLLNIYPDSCYSNIVP